ncbi:MAG: chromosome partitioning protein ParB [Candidatus Contendobacter odensis]|uniref:Probable chromosome-partitioning protein ParB n=1 Tax=Candidatus Contendibacter odensensis TaxID=1400860 RepID=A0A2G6PGE5_9GAMM|nr:MAG: chromosome partitioning protein ParB [Candidatus Contendobacter odensis]
MMRKKGGLGRGLDALLGAGVEHVESRESLRQLPIDQIHRSRYQPRQDLREDTLQDLADSIRTQGLVQPVVVRSLDEGGYELIAGERRWRASQLAGLQEIPAVIREASDQTVVAMALIENIQREDLNPLEEAQALQRLIAEFDLTHQQAAEAVGRSRATVSNLLRLLELAEDVQQWVRARKLDMGHARALLQLPLSLQREAAQQVLLHGLSARETENLVRRLRQKEQGCEINTVEQSMDPNVRLLQDDLSERFGAKVQVRHGVSGKGRVIIHYNTLDELDGIVSKMK